MYKKLHDEIDVLPKRVDVNLYVCLEGRYKKHLKCSCPTKNSEYLRPVDARKAKNEVNGKWARLLFNRLFPLHHVESSHNSNRFG